MATFEEFTKKHLKKDQNRTTVNASKVRDGDSFTDFTKKRLGLSSDTSAEADGGKRTWFQAGALSDGYKFGDVLRSVRGTVDDIQESAWAGILGMGEQVVDAGAYLLGGAGSLFGADEFADSIKEFIAGDLYDERKVANVINYILHPDSILADSDNSFFGDKTDSLLQSAGQLAGTAGLQALGVPWWLTTGITSFGGEVDNAFDQGASYLEAGGSAAVSAGVELLTEKLFGGSGLGEKGLINLDGLTKAISNKAVKILVDYGVDMTAEGVEELLSSVFSRLGSNFYKREDIAKLLTSEEAMDEYLESFIGGAVLSGAGNISKVQGSLKTGRDYRTGLTDVEKKVFDKEYEQRISGAEDGGKKLSGKEKSRIYDEVMEDLKSGGIDIGVIEEVLGGDSYKSYKTAIDEEATLRKEFEELGKKERPTLADQSRYTELNEQIKALEKDSGREVLKQKYEKEAYELSKGGYLAESYNERTRSKQAFKADLTKYTEKERAIVQKAIDSGLLNDTRKAHNFVDFVAKMCADQGIGFDFTSNERLKKSGLGIEGRTVNGYVTKDGITVNLNSAKALNKVVGHELTHVLEGTELYGSLRDSVFEYASVKGELDGKRKALEKLYEGIEGADIDSELTADLIGDYVFRDTDFISTLSRRHRSIFQRLYDEIKHLCKLATAGSKEARELEKVKRAFEKAYREGGKEHTDDSDALKHREEAKDEGSPAEEAPAEEAPAEEAPAEAEGKPIQVSDTETITPQQAQALNIMASTIISEARNNNISLEQYYAATSEVNAYSPTKAEVLTIADALEPIARQLGNENYSSYIDAIRAYAEDGGVKFSLSETADGRSVAVVDDDILSGIYTGTWDKATAEKAKKAAKTALLKFKDGIAVRGINVKVNKASRNEYSRSNYSEALRNHDPDAYADKLRAASVADDIIIAATDWKRDGGLTHPRKDDFVDFDKGKTLIMAGTNKYTATVTVGVTAQGEYVFYDVVDVNPTQFDIKNEGDLPTVTPDIPFDDILKVSNADIIPQNSEKVNRKNSISETFPDDFPIRSDLGSDIYGKDVALEFPIRKDIAGNNVDAEAKTGADGGDDIAIKTTNERLLEKLKASETELENVKRIRDEDLQKRDARIEALVQNYEQKKRKDTKTAGAIRLKIERAKRIRTEAESDFTRRIEGIERRIAKINEEMQKDHSREDALERRYQQIDKRLEEQRAEIDAEYDRMKAELEAEVADKNTFISKRAKALYDEICGLKKGVRASSELGYILDHGYEWSKIKTALINVKNRPSGTVDTNSQAESVVREMMNEIYEDAQYTLSELDAERQSRITELEKSAESERTFARKEGERIRRKELEQKKVEQLVQGCAAKGLDLFEALKKAKNLPTFITVDLIPQRLMEKTFGYKAGQIIADETVNKVAQNETEAIRWLNGYTDRKNGVLAQLVNDYKIKPGSKESAAAQMYAEGFYVNDKKEYVAYGDAELAKDFPDVKTQENIKKLARDPRIRQIYDDTLAMINESRERNGYEAIPRLDNYFLHFRAMDDTFSRIGLPFNPNDISAKNLPTDLNGVTANLKPGQPYFASAKHRLGIRTSYDILGALESYLSSAKNQIYHIDDIQTCRAFRNLVADMFGQAKGLEGIDEMSDAEAQERIKEVFNGHLSTFAKWLNEEANILAGKTALIDRGLEGVFGREGITFLDTVNKQVGSNMVGYNLSSPLTNLLPAVQAFAKTNKGAFIKAFGQTGLNILNRLRKAPTDGFTEKSSVIVRRRGADRFYRKPYQKAADAGYVLMSFVDNVTTELVTRAKYNELTAKGMTSEQAHYETDKWVSRLMGDRSLGQMPHLYNSKILGLFTKFQLEVRNQLDSQYYDTIKEAEAEYEDIKDQQKRNKAVAVKVTSTFLQLAVLQHFFGATFEAVAGYNPAFDIIEAILTAAGVGDDDDSEDTPLDNLEQGLLTLLEDMPYSSFFMDGGRIPASAALPISEWLTGTDEYGNEKSRWATLGEALPYYFLPGGYGQLKKTAKGLWMFAPDKAVSGSYTDSGGLRYPVEATPGNIIQAGVFGPWANGNAQQYINEGRTPLNEKQVEELDELGIPIAEYWDYLDGLRGLSKLSEKADYIAGLDLTTKQKNLLINNIAGRKEPIDMSDYGDYGSFEEFDFAHNNPEKYLVARAVGGYDSYVGYMDAISGIKTDKDEDGKAISGSRKKKVIKYLNSLKIDYAEKLILFKSTFKGDDTYNSKLIEGINGIGGLSDYDKEALLESLGFEVDDDGNVTWD